MSDSQQEFFLWRVIPFLISVNVFYLLLCFLESIKGLFPSKITHKYIWSVVVALVGMYFAGLITVAGVILLLISVNAVYLLLCFLELIKGFLAVEMPSQSQAQKQPQTKNKFGWSFLVMVALIGVMNSVPSCVGSGPGYDYPEPGSPADVYGDTNETGPDTVLLPNGKRYGRKELEAYSWKVSGD